MAVAGANGTAIVTRFDVTIDLDRIAAGVVPHFTDVEAGQRSPHTSVS
jgi:hypothetical protein